MWGRMGNYFFPNHPPFSDVLYGRVPAIASWPLYFMSMRGYGAYLQVLVGILPEIQNLWLVYKDSDQLYTSTNQCSTVAVSLVIVSVVHARGSNVIVFFVALASHNVA